MNRSRMLGIGLLIGGLLVSIVIAYMMIGYYLGGQFSLWGTVLWTAVALGILVLPQLWFGVYLLRWQQEQNE